jgi:hypothetical protein
MSRNNYDSFMSRRAVSIDTANLDAASQFKPFFDGPRIKVEGPTGIRFGVVSMTTGHKPVFLLVHRDTDTGSSDVLGKDDKVIAVKNGSGYVPV